jgi:phosphatidylserine/phosphatidylglycerophosphate/cardiolipin synthase-like enzyme
MTLAAKAVAITNNDYVHIAWDFGHALEECGGFAVYRVTMNGSVDGGPLPSFARDQQGNRLCVTCEDQPIRKYSWRDVVETRGRSYSYRIVAMRSPRQPLAGVPVLQTSWITVSPRMGNAQVYFNRGILATQRDPAHKKPNFAKIEALINDEHSHLRKSLSGQLFEAVTQLLDGAAKDGGSCWASLYELTDPCLIDRLSQCRNLHLILSNDNAESGPNPYDGKNQPAVKELHNTAQELIRRYMPEGQIGHNKFLVYVDAKQQPKAVLTGSTNWTTSGLCTQSNNAILIESDALAEQYLAYWKQLKADELAAGVPRAPAPVKTIQGTELRTECDTPRKTSPLNKNSTVTVWFSPNTQSLSGKSKDSDKDIPPSDMGQVYKILGDARQSVLFLAFMPGKAGSANTHHFLQELGRAAERKPALFIRGAVSDPALTREYDRASLSADVPEDSMISSPAGIFRDFQSWRTEIYKYGHAIVHDKIIVIDPFDARRCVVITGSHNLGYRASSNNDENMLIIRGDAGTARAYAAHVMDIFEHYRSRWIYAGKKTKDYDSNNDPNWQAKYFNPSRPACAERLFWVSDGKPLPALLPNSRLDLARKRLEHDSARRKAEEARKAAKPSAKSGPATKEAEPKKNTPPGSKPAAGPKSAKGRNSR